MNENEKAVAAVLATYQDAMNASDTDALLRLYAPDGVLMAQHFPTSVGPAAVRQAYESVFKACTLSVSSPVAEVRELSLEWVIARTNSAGTVKVHESSSWMAGWDRCKTDCQSQIRINHEYHGQRPHQRRSRQSFHPDRWLRHPGPAGR